MKERPILFSAPMVRAILAGKKTQTRRVMNSKHFRLEMCETSNPPHLRYNEFNTRRCEGLYESGSGPWDPSDPSHQQYACSFNPYGQPGDRLWVKETFFIDDFRFYPKGRLPKTKPDLEDRTILYRADGSCCDQLGECECGGKGATWRPSIFMPRWASRILLEISAVRVERLQEISESDAWAEGCLPGERDSRGGRFPAEQLHPDGKGLIGWDDAREWYAWLWEQINGPGSWDANPWVWVVEFSRVGPDLAMAACTHPRI